MYAQKADGLGSVNRLTDSSGNTVNTYTYDAWGSPTQTGTLSNPFEFTAREWDSTNALYYDRARFYDPSANGAHRFLSMDPAGGGYAYVGDSPANFVDPSGMIGVAYHHARCPIGGDCTGGGGGGSPTGPAGSRGGGGTNPVLSYLNRCAAQATVFVLGVALSVLGAYFMYSMLEANAILDIEAGVTAAEGGGAAAGGSLAFDIGAIVEQWNDPWAVAGAVVDILSWVFWTLIVPNAGWLQDAILTAEFGGELTPVGWAVLAGSVLASAAIGYAALSSAGCGWF